MIWFLSSFQSKLSKEVEDIYASLIHQTYFLESHLEKEKGGNHLIENCKALIISGTFFNKKVWA